MSDRARVTFAALGALIAWAGLLVQLILTLRLATARSMTVGEGVAIYLSYFTIITNLLVALALTAGVAAPTRYGRMSSHPALSTTLAAGVVVVGAGYHVLLRGMWDPRGWHFAADIALHYVTPLVFLVYWWLSIDKQRLSAKVVPLTLCYPLAYFVYVLLRGELTEFYPYPFVDVERLGYARVVANAAGLALVYLVVATLLVAIARRRATGPLSKR